MASKDSKVDSNDEDSFIVLGTSPGGTLQSDIDQYFNEAVLDASQLDDALKDSATSPFKASFRLSDGPSSTSLMKASTIITDDKSVEDLQHRFGELLDETEILKVTLKKNNESMKEHMMLIATCQEDMLKTHKLHQEKFDETRVLVERLKEENKKLKDDRLSEGSKSLPDSETGEDSKSEGPKSEEPKSVELKSGPPSAVEFVSSPDDDTINKLSSQLALVEKQRREVIVENEKLTWQKESLEKILDATSNERDGLKDKIKNLELHLSGMETEYIMKMNGLNTQIKELQTKLEVSSSDTMVSLSEIAERDMRINRLDGKVAELQNELKASKLRILELETVKLEFAKGKGEAAETAKLHKDQIQELHNRLKEAQTTVFQPMRCSLSIERDASGLYSDLQSHVKLYDKTLKHLADLLNAVTHGTSESLVQTLAVVSSLHDYKLDKTTAEQVRQGLANARDQLQRQHSAALNNVAQVKGALSIFEGIFKDHKELLQKAAENKEVTTENASAAPNIEALTAGLLARSQEIDMLKGQMVALKEDKENVELMKAQLELYKSDFEAERSARAALAGEKELSDARLRVATKQYQDLKSELESIRKLGAAAGGAPPPPGPRRAAPHASPNGNAAKQTTLYTCPKCMRFTSEDYAKLEDHFDFCLDDF